MSPHIRFAGVAVNTRAHLRVLVFLACSTAASAQDGAGDDYHPTPSQVEGLQQSCTVSEAGLLPLQEKLGRAISEWSNATADTRPVAAMKQLDAVFERLSRDEHLTGRKEIYVLCVEKALRQFVDSKREMPQVVSGSGSSKPLPLARFSSEEEIWRSGCRDAEADALARLQPRCGDRTFVIVNSECPQGTGNLRTYTAQVQGECRGK